MTAILARARAGEYLGGELVNPSVSSQAFAQMAAEQPIMHLPQGEALEGAENVARSRRTKPVANTLRKWEISKIESRQARLKPKLPPDPTAVSKIRRYVKVAGE